MSRENRRDFIQKSAAAAAGASLMAAPAIAKSRQSANDRLRVCLVGLRGRGRRHLEALHEMAKENVEIAAFCDCDERIAQTASENYEKRTGKKIPVIVDYQKMLEDKSIDAVSLATPNHWHALQTIWACQAKKDVLVEKPASHNIWEGKQMIKAAEKYGIIVQHGTQCRASPNIREGIQKLHEGAIGRIYMVRGVAFKRRASGRDDFQPVPPGMHWDKWLGPAPDAKYNLLAIQRWRFLKQYGNGEIGDQGVHQLDIMRWGLQIDTHPNRVQSMGGMYMYPTGDQTTPGTQTFSCQYDDHDIMLQFDVRNGYTNPEAGMGTEYPFVDHRNVVGVIFLGTEGYMIFPNYSSYYTFLGSKREPGPSASTEGAPMMDLDLFQNWASAIRQRDPSTLMAPIQEGYLSSVLPHLANIAYETRRTLEFDPKSETFIGDDEANQYLTRDYRAPYIVPQEV
ncbi:Alpha-N-acetylgalactosaminidase [Planctomycetales bacterium 10988]|nr:Alpha-N-acetylgalactosaminidase [Planctomycetales bacterium 10988]